MLVLIGGGSGITPLLFDTEGDSPPEPKSRILLLYGNRDEANIIFKSDYFSHLQKSGGRPTVVHVFEQPTQAMPCLPDA